MNFNVGFLLRSKFLRLTRQEEISGKVVRDFEDKSRVMRLVLGEVWRDVKRLVRFIDVKDDGPRRRVLREHVGREREFDMFVYSESGRDFPEMLTSWRSLKSLRRVVRLEGVKVLLGRRVRVFMGLEVDWEDVIRVKRGEVDLLPQADMTMR